MKISKKIVLLILLSSLFLLSSCTMSSFQNRRLAGVTEDLYVGTQGLEIEFLEQAPPGEVYETGTFDVQTFISNKGTFSLVDNYTARISLIYDKAKLKKITDNIIGNYRNTYANKTFISLHGKSYYYPSGEQNYFAIDRFEAKDIVGNFETAQTTFGLGVCYPYQTTFVDSVCVDTDPQNMDPRVDACSAEDKTYSGGQGAPVGVTAIDSLMIPRGSNVQPTFEIYFKNLGDGYVTQLTDDALIPTGPKLKQKTCGDLSKSQPNLLTITAYLGENKLLCTQAVLKEGKGRVECQLKESQITLNTANYMTSLRITFDYIYSQSFTKTIGIKQSDISTLDAIQSAGPEFCSSWQLFDGNNCVDICEVYAKTNPELLALKGLESKDQNLSGAKCLYSDPNNCIYADNLCLIDSKGLCQRGRYCGLPECLNNNRAPQVNPLGTQGSPVTRVEWSCNDLDDLLDTERTCGCMETGYYLYINKTKSCRNIDVSTMKTIKGRDISFKGMVFGLDHPDPEKKLCVMVKDKLGTTSKITKLDI